METKQHLKTLYHCVYNLHYHLVLVTKYRRKCLTPAMRDHLRSTFDTLLKKWGGTLVECNGEGGALSCAPSADAVAGNGAALSCGPSAHAVAGNADHIHVLMELPPTVTLSTVVNNLKTVSSRLLRKAYGQELARWYRQPVLWSRSYCVLSCGGAPLSVLRQYIEQQGSGAS